jgi:hypothetical protein
MHRKILGVLITAAIIAVACGCVRDDSPTGTDVIPQPTDFELYIHFDTIRYFVTLADFSIFYPNVYERAVNWEQSLGEPYTDVNGNGVYDEGIDIFIKALDPAVNQDLNRNNRYDGPDDPWEVGIPFDDIDGDGQFRVNPEDGGRYYEIGLPFVDYNDNENRDSGVSAFAIMSAFSVAHGLNGDLWYSTQNGPWGTYAGYRFVSDSGLVYDHTINWSVSAKNLLVTDSGLIFYAFPSWFDMAVPLLVVDTGDFVEVQNDVQIVPIDAGDTVAVSRTVRLDEPLGIGGYGYVGLVNVELTSESFGYDFFFDRDQGLIAYGEYTVTGALGEDTTSYYYYYVEPVVESDSIILPMTR